MSTRLLDCPKKFKQNIVRLSYCMTGKMTDILSLSTNVNRNSRCMHRHNCMDTICANCFAIETVNSYDSLHRNLNWNTDNLIDRVLEVWEVMAIAMEIVQAIIKNNTSKFRYESFGDLNNKIHALNYLHIADMVYVLSRKFSHKIEQALWTKNADYLISAWKELDPKQISHLHKGLNILCSSTFMGIPIGNGFVEKTEKALGMPIGIFTVEKEENEKTNCAARACNICGRCYKKFKKTTYIWEVLKKLH